MFDVRMQFLDKFDSFIDKASLTDEQRRAVLGIIADMQLQSLLAWEEIGKATSAEDLPSMSEIDKTLRAEMFSRLRETLNHDQMVHFRRTGIIGRPLQYGNYMPLEGTEFARFVQPPN